MLNGKIQYACFSAVFFFPLSQVFLGRFAFRANILTKYCRGQPRMIRQYGHLC